MTVALVYDERMLAHDNGSMLLDERAQGWLDVPHAENAARIARAYQVLERSGALDALERVPARAATEDDLRLVHTAGHVEAIRAACEGDRVVVVGPGARAGPASWEPALLSAGAALAGVDWALEGPDRRAYVLARPPGHHASADEAMGFCLFNNVAIAARRAQRRHELERVAIVDWDVHHGNGTETLLAEDPSVLFVSLHQDDLYPKDRGRVEDPGVNVPLPAGAGDAAYLDAMRRVVAPALRDFAPELVLLSSGQDAGAADTHGRMSLTADGFRALTQELLAAAGGVPVVAVQEGGYSVDHMPFCLLATVEALAGLEPSLPSDPLELDAPSEARDVDRAAVDAALRHGVVR